MFCTVKTFSNFSLMLKGTQTQTQGKASLCPDADYRLWFSKPVKTWVGGRGSIVTATNWAAL